ncbi:slightly ste11-like protein [Umbelopsis nana]
MRAPPASVDSLQAESKKHDKAEKIKDSPKLTRHGHEIPRPKNCFLSYRQDVASALVEIGLANNSRSISKIVAELWRTESENIKEEYRKIAQEEKEKHQALYPDYKYMPRRKERCEERGATEYSTNNPPRKISRVARSPSSDRLESKRLRSKNSSKRSSYNKKNVPKQDGTPKAVKTMAAKISNTKNSGRLPLYTKFTLVKKLIETGIMPADKLDDVTPPMSSPPFEQCAEDSIIHSEQTEADAENFDEGHFDLKSPEMLNPVNTLLEQEGFSLHSSLFSSPERKCGRTDIKDCGTLPISPKLQYIPDIEIDPCNIAHSQLVLHLIHDIGSNPIQLTLTKIHLDMLESQCTVSPSSLTPSLSAMSHCSEVGGEPTENELDPSSGNPTPFYQELIETLADEKQVDEYFEKLSTPEDAPMLSKLSNRCQELALLLPAIWSTDRHTVNTPPANFDVVQEGDDQEVLPGTSAMLLDDYIDVGHN